MVYLMKQIFYTVSYCRCRLKTIVTMSSNADLAVQATSTDASVCKKYAVQKGYWKDNFINAMVRSTPKSKQPEINQGYYARTESIWQVINKFVTKFDRKCQIVSLGAGLDTTFWRLSEENLHPQLFVELDFSNVVSKKLQIIKSQSIFLHHLLQPGPQQLHEDIVTNNYCLVSADLRDLNEVIEKLTKCSIQYEIPTLFMAECVLVYMPSVKSNAIINWVAKSFPVALFINYEQVNMNSNFGKVMVENLRLRSCELPGVDVCESLDTQERRFLQNNWTNVNCVTMWSAFHMLPQADVHRIQKIEFLDEVELLQQLLTHYCLCVAYKYNGDNDISSIFL